MTPKENLLTVIRDHKKPEWTPSYLGSCFNAGLSGMDLENGAPGVGIDAFGVKWISSASTGGALTPDPKSYVLEDITKWKKTAFPDVWAFDWDEYAKRAYPPFFNADTMVKGFSVSGPFQRMEALMGFENCLLAMYEEPEATFDFMSAVADYNIEMLKAAKKYLNIDTFDLADDMATQRSLFMSPEVYRKLIKPNHARVFRAIKEEGLIAEHHLCGHADAIIDDLVEMGVDVWQSVQPMNDIEGILQKYGNRIALVGGFDSNGNAAITKDESGILEEVHHCFDVYGKYDSYIFWGFLIMDDPRSFELLQLMTRESLDYPRSIASKGE